MEGILPKELIIIVHRYVFDHHYSQVMAQYEKLWLNDIEDEDDDNIRWDDKPMSFVTDDRYVANWRDLVHPCTDIFTFYDNKQHLKALPKRY